MKALNVNLVSLLAILSAAAGISLPVEVHAQASVGGVDVAQQPLFTASGQPPLNMLVMGKDHKIYYEAYNDASDLNGDGALDIGYKPGTLDYYGYFNSFACYNYSTDHFVPVSATSNKKCSGSWSGDFLNYLTTSRMDALRRVLYGGWRQVDSTTQTILQGAFFPQDAHSWGKEYQSVARDGYDIADYAPLTAPPDGTYHLFAVTTLTGNANSYSTGYQAPVFRVLQNTPRRVWNWLSIEGPVGGNKCFTEDDHRVACVPPSGGTGIWEVVPSSWYAGLTITTWRHSGGHPANSGAFDGMFATYGTTSNLCGTGPISTIDVTGSGNNPFSGNNSCNSNNYLTLIEGTITVPADGNYKFGVDGDDAVDVQIDSTIVAGWYNGHGNDRSDAGLDSHSGTIYLTAGTHTIRFRHEEVSGGDNWGLFIHRDIPDVTRDDYLVRVETCPSSSAALRDSLCKEYPNGQFKPTGILHDYGETEKMYFGLITGSQNNNLEGGVLRRNVSSFASEIDSNTGQFLSGVNGVANTINRLRMIGGSYENGTVDNSTADSNWAWGGGTGNCPSVGNRAINNGECRMWGNPLAEMLYESMRYFAGAGAPITRFNTGGATAGTNEETTMGLTRETWKDPYADAPGGGGYLACSRPFQTIISDINPSYDGDLPGSPFTGAVTTINNTPATISSFDAAAQGQAIWNSEFGAGARDVFIGDSNNSTDDAPTAKSASSFGNIRGLAPEEPSKKGTYFSASVARYARMTDLNAVVGDQALSTYSIALASPLPRITFPVADGVVTLLPFAKTASGTFGDGARKPTNTIVDFYVERIVNLPGQPFNATINDGRPFAIFRINYEDVEQGNDHDMDAIVRYFIAENADNTVTVSLSSEYAAGSANQIIGYVMSGTTQDGVYLDVRDTDSSGGAVPLYALSTPNPLLPGDCGASPAPPACTQALPFNSTRVFTPSSAGSGATLLENPLFYAAKYGAPSGLPGGTGTDPNDLDGDGVPDNYFLVTNPATLRSQLDKAFANIIANAQPTASVATSTPRYTPGATLAYEASYKSSDWSGDVKAYALRSDATYNGAPVIWSASNRMPAHSARNIYTAEPITGGFAGVPFTTTGMSAAMLTTIQGSLNTTVFDNGELIDYLRGDSSNEQGATGCVISTDCPYRIRSSKLGDILNSTPAVIGVTSFGYGSILKDLDPTAAAAYPAYVEGKKTLFGNNSETPVLFVGANDGMLHAIDGREGTGGGVELFAYVPNAVLGNLHELASPGYVHRYFVDASPTVSDAYLGTWKSILLGSTGAGARAVYALDISNPRNFDENDVMWEFNDSLDTDMGQFVGRPYMGMTEGGQWVAAFGNGLNSANQRAFLYILDLSDGSVIAKIDTGYGCPSTDASCTQGPNGLATAILVDNTGNGAADTIYAGDYQGNMWRFEQSLSDYSWSLGNGGNPIFVARDSTGKRQSITSGVYPVANPIGGTMVVFGTGRYLNANDHSASQLGVGTRASEETLYGIWDSRGYDPVNGTWTDFFPITSTRASGEYVDLERQWVTSYEPLTDAGTNGYRTATRNVVDYRLSSTGTGKLGWYMDLSCSACPSGQEGSMDGERVTATPQGILSDVVFNTFRPEGDNCTPGSLNATMVLDALTGAADYVPIPPPGGWGSGMEPPDGALVGTDTVRGPPPGEPPIVIIRPPNPGVPCLQGTDGCDPPAPECAAGDPECVCDDPDDPSTCHLPVIGKCSWRSPNSAGRPPGKSIPCGRISWKQIR